MIKLSNYPNINSKLGEIHKKQSDMIMEYTWDTDINSRIAYIYDYYHDNEPLKYYDLHPENNNTGMIPIEIKFISNAFNSENKDQVGWHIQFKPSFRWENVEGLSYYQQDFIEKWDAQFPIGLYFAIPDEKGIYRKWLCVENANNYNVQFPTWYILPIDYIFQWIYNGKKYQMCGVSRSQNSYNSGIWTDYKFTLPENQRKCVLPMNDISTTIFYNQRIAISAKIKEPIVWKCTKVEQTAPKGTNRLTFAQDQWDDHKDIILDDGIWCDYKTSSVIPEDYNYNPEQIIHKQIIISFNGSKPEIKIGGNGKQLSANYYINDELVQFENGNWYFYIDDKNVSSIIDLTQISENTIRIKINNNYKQYINKTLVIKFISDSNIESKLELAIKNL